MPLCPYFILMFTSYLTQGYYVASIYPNIIFQILPSYSRPMMSHYVTYHVTAVSCASSLSKRKIKIKQNKINIKLEKQEKLSVSKAFYNIESIQTSDWNLTSSNKYFQSFLLEKLPMKSLKVKESISSLNR